MVGHADDVSADGSVVVGFGRNVPGQEFDTFRWTETTGIVFLYPGEDPIPSVVSADGLTIASNSGGAFLWTAARGVVGPDRAGYVDAISAGWRRTGGRACSRWSTAWT